jgi:hypothetical protein
MMKARGLEEEIFDATRSFSGRLFIFVMQPLPPLPMPLSTPAWARVPRDEDTWHAGETA